MSFVGADSNLRCAVFATVGGLAVLAALAGCGASSDRGASGGDSSSTLDRSVATTVPVTSIDAASGTTVASDGAPSVEVVPADQPGGPGQSQPAAIVTPTAPYSPPPDTEPPATEPPGDPRLPASNPLPLPAGYTMIIPQYADGMHSWNYKYPDRDCRTLVESALPAANAAGWVMATGNAGPRWSARSNPKDGVGLIISCENRGNPYVTLVYAYYAI